MSGETRGISEEEFQQRLGGLNPKELHVEWLENTDETNPDYVPPKDETEVDDLLGAHNIRPVGSEHVTRDEEEYKEAA